MRKSTSSRPTTSWRAAATAIEAFNNVTEIISPHDGPLMINEIIDYLQKIGTVRTVVEGRITFKS